MGVLNADPPATTTQPVPPPPILEDNLWTIEADPAALETTAQAWRELAVQARSSVDTVETPALTVEGDWQGLTADAWRNHRSRLLGDIDEAAGDLDRAAGALENVAAKLRCVQGRLTDDFETLRGQVNVSVHFEETVACLPADDDDVTTFRRAVNEAKDLRNDMDQELITLSAPLPVTRTSLSTIFVYWLTAAGAGDTWVDGSTLPPEARGTAVIQTADEFIVNTGAGDDSIEVVIRDGQRIIIVNGREFPVPDGVAIVIRGGSGNDTITVAEGVNVKVTALGGADDDTITTRGGRDTILAGDGVDTVDSGSGSDWVSGGQGDDVIRTGKGRDRVFAGAGADEVYSGEGNDAVNGGTDNDYIEDLDGRDQLVAGDGDDTVYGGDGNDRVLGEGGRDYLEGGSDDDTLFGGSGDDTISGGRDDDTAHGGSGDDVLYAGHGTDQLDGETDDDRAFAETGDEVRAEDAVTIFLHDIPNIEVEGSPEFEARVRQDLEMLRGSEAGQLMFNELDKFIDRGHTITIRELPADADKLGDTDVDKASWFDQWNENHTIRLTPDGFTAAEQSKRPITVLFHEMAHVYDNGNDTSAGGDYEDTANPDSYVPPGETDRVAAPNEERQAVGLPIDHDGDPSTPMRIDPDHPLEYTENALRKEMGIPERETYGDPIQPP